MPKIDPDFIRREAAAAKLCVSLRQLNKLAALGKIPEPYRFGPNCVLYSEREIDAHLERQSQDERQTG